MGLVCESRSKRWRLVNTANTSASSVGRYVYSESHQLIHYITAIAAVYLFFICMSFGLKCGGANQIVNCLVVCCEEKGSGDLGLQGLRQSQSRRCIYIEVIFFSFSCLYFPELIFPLFSLMGTNTLFYFCYSTASAVTVRSTIRRLREQTES